MLTLSKYALILKLEFFEAHFKVHYTKGFRLTYPIPLPTSVAGIFASMMGIERKRATERFKGYKFGATLANGQIKESVEQVTFLQYAKNRKGVAKTHILVNPAYYLVAACEVKDEIENMKNRINEGIEYLPFGGQNDFFVKDWILIGVKDVQSSIEIGNYLPGEMVQGLTEGVSLEILPVMHKLGFTQDFYFILNGHVISKREMPVCSINGKNVALYILDDFYPVGEWST